MKLLATLACVFVVVSSCLHVTSPDVLLLLVLEKFAIVITSLVDASRECTGAGTV